MPKLVWDRMGTRRYESGLDRGVLYLPDGRGVPWNGLTEISETSSLSVDPIYYDGMKVGETVIPGDYEASLQAITFPDEFAELQGIGTYRRGVYVYDQVPQRFSFSYRTRVGTDTAGDEERYKLHVVYNALASLSDVTYASVSDDPEIVPFEWNITAIPEEVPGIRPTAHIVIETEGIDPFLLEDLEKLLYGSASTTSYLPPMADLMEFIHEWFRVKIIDNGDGTWTAIESRPGFIQMLGDDMFRIKDVSAFYIDDGTFVVSDTTDVLDSPRIDIQDNGDGTWTATTDDDNVIVTFPDGRFEVRSIDAIFAGPEMYRISDQTTEH